MKIIKIIRVLIICILIGILLSISYSKFIKKDYIIKIFGKALLIVSTGSMEPTISSGTLILISEKQKYDVGDIVTYLDEDNFLITHRIIALDEKENMITKGDANNLNDKKISLNRIEGKVIFKSEACGFFVLYLLKPIILAYIFSLIIYIIICDVLNKKEVENNKEKNIKNNFN